MSMALSNTDNRIGFHRAKSIIYEIASVLITLCAVHAMLQLSCHQGIKSLLNTILFGDHAYLLLNISLYMLFFAVVVAVSGSPYMGKALSLIFGVIVALVNYYTIEWHGGPLTIKELKNARTAVNVLGAYRFEIHKQIILILAIFGVSLLIVSVVQIREKKKSCWCKRNVRIASLAMTLGLILLWGVGWDCFIPEDPVGWSLKGGYQGNGYLITTIGREVRFTEPVQKPIGYEKYPIPELNDDALTPETNKSMVFPDIIMILNETFFDPAVLFDLKSDTPYLDNYSSLTNCQRGYTIVPQAGGGTNKSEYEYLTGNSMQLMPEITPFNVLDLDNSYTVVSYLKHFGYKTTAMHPADPENYNRAYAYRKMGFDNIFFYDDINDLGDYYNRYWATDQSLFNNLTYQYEQMKTDEEPMFFWLLTTQNHGGFEQNPPEYDTVHIEGAFDEEFIQKTNEFLTSIQMSDEAVKSLIDYYSKVDRPVVICMTGDHCPGYMARMGEASNDIQKKLAAMKTPYFVWSNYLELSTMEESSMSLNYFMPSVLDVAGIPLPEYYSRMLKLKNDVPVLTADGYYIDKGEEIHSYSDQGAMDSKIKEYHMLEYANIMKDQRYKAFFDLPDYE